MLRKLIAVVTPLLGAGLTFATVYLLLRMTVETELMEDSLRRSLAIFGIFIAGVLLLLASVYVCTRVAVFLFARPQAGQKTDEPGNLPR